VRTMMMTLGVLALLGSGCISSRCLRDADCTEGLVCREETFACVEPECSADSECGRGKVCEKRFCVEGCVTVADCNPDQVCLDRRCRDVGPECDCPMAPEFCGTDINPSSTTAEARLCVPDSFPDGVALFFGSIGCGHCTAIYDALKPRIAQLRAEGLAPKLIWVQVPTLPATPSDVYARLGAEGTVPVILDTVELGIWPGYAAAWYDVILVDRHGCLLQTFPSLDATQLNGEVGDQLVAAWRDAMDEACPTPLDGGDAGTDAGDGGDADASDDGPTEVSDDAATDRADVPEDLPDVLDAADEAIDVVEDVPDADDGTTETSMDGS